MTLLDTQKACKARSLAKLGQLVIYSTCIDDSSAIAITKSDD